MRLDEPDTESADSAAGGGCGTGDQPLFARGAVTRTFDTPGFRGMTFYEVQAKSIITGSRPPPAWPSPGQSTLIVAVSIHVFTVCHQRHRF